MRNVYHTTFETLDGISPTSELPAIKVTEVCADDKTKTGVLVVEFEEAGNREIKKRINSLELADRERVHEAMEIVPETVAE